MLDEKQYYDHGLHVYIITYNGLRLPNEPILFCWRSVFKGAQNIQFTSPIANIGRT